MSPEGPLPARLLSSNSRASACTSRSMPARTAWYCPSPAPASTQLSPYQNTGVEQGNCSTRQELAYANLVTFRSCFTFASGQQFAEIDGRRGRHLMGQPDSQGYPMRCVGPSLSSSARPPSQACLQQHENLGSQPSSPNTQPFTSSPGIHSSRHKRQRCKRSVMGHSCVHNTQVNLIDSVAFRIYQTVTSNPNPECEYK